MVKQLTRIGDTYGIVIDQPILDLLKIGPETPLKVTSNGESLVIRPQRAAIGQVAEIYADTFRRLAK